MPILKTRHNFTKVYRPNGARYAHGKTCDDATAAVISAMDAWEKEFGPIPRPNEMFIEVLGVTGGWAATIFELKE